MRKFFLSLIAVLSLTLIVAPIGAVHAKDTLPASPYSAQKSPRAIPSLDPGGCSSITSNSAVGGKACISYDGFNGNVLPDTYVSFYNFGHGGVATCIVRIELYQGTTYITRDQYNCAVQAAQFQKNVHFGPTAHGASGSTDYSCIVKVNLSYNDQTYAFWTSEASPGVTPEPELVKRKAHIV